MFKKYQIVYFNQAGAETPRSLRISLLPLLLLLLCIVMMIICIIWAQLHIGKLNNIPVAILGNKDLKNADEWAIRYTNIVLDSAVKALQTNDKLAEDIFKTPIINNSYRYSEFSEKYTASRAFANLLAVNSRMNYSNLQSLSQMISRLKTELDLRASNYIKLEAFLEEQYVIYMHTPNIWPSPTERITSQFGFRKSPFTGIPSYHEGTDFAAMTGTKIVTTADGVVVHAGTRTGYGYLVTVDHGFGYMTRYAHNSKLLVSVGDKVKKGDILSLSGSTGRSAGPHLHYEVLYNGTPINARKFLPGLQ